MQRARILLVIVSLVVSSFSGIVSAQDWKTVLNLKGTWRFQLGDDMKWADPRFQDSDWDNIKVPSSWEDEGYPGYDGYAWYRKHFTLEKEFKDEVLYLQVGYVDDVSEVYLNGHMVGFEGQFPPKFITAYNIARPYIIPRQYFNYDGDNVIAVRVYDLRLVGGITHGKVGIFEARNSLRPDLDLAGKWKFRTGDNMSWKNPKIPDEGWGELIVPSYWEVQGFKDYDGFAWYRLTFKVPENFRGKTVILLLGKIDDLDETYLNGELIGRTGRMRKGMTRDDISNEYAKPRVYSIPKNLLVPGGTNVVAVRVNDVYMHGGIYDGPVGLVTREKYLDWKEDHANRWDPFEWFK